MREDIETDLVLFLFCFGALTLLLSWPSVPKERESSAVSVSTLEPLGCVWEWEEGHQVLFWWWGWECCQEMGVVTCESDLQLGKPSSPGFRSIICQIKCSGYRRSG